MTIKRLIFDADDTLWENNIHYLQASDDFFGQIQKAGFSRQEIENDFDELELKVVQERGYGSINFVYILEELFNRYNSHSGKALDQEYFKTIIRRFVEHPTGKPALFAGVRETLDYLTQKYDLFILTKGDYQEQSGKINRAEFGTRFKDFFIPPEKNDQTYMDLLSKHDWLAEETCMIGNSPKSDINPALRSGMFAVHIPYINTWKLDNEPIQSIDGRLTVINTFSELKNIF